MRWTIEQLKSVRESEDKVEFKRGEGGNVAYDGGSLVIGMDDKYPHRSFGTKQVERRRLRKGNGQQKAKKQVRKRVKKPNPAAVSARNCDY